MSGPTESEIKKEIADYLALFRSRCLFTVNLAGRRGYKSKHLVAGWPDITGSWDGVPLGIEVKKPGGAISLEQHEFMNRAKSMGWIAFIAVSVADVQKELSFKSRGPQGQGAEDQKATVPPSAEPGRDPGEGIPPKKETREG